MKTLPDATRQMLRFAAYAELKARVVTQLKKHDESTILNALLKKYVVGDERRQELLERKAKLEAERDSGMHKGVTGVDERFRISESLKEIEMKLKQREATAGEHLETLIGSSGIRENIKRVGEESLTDHIAFSSSGVKMGMEVKWPTESTHASTSANELDLLSKEFEQRDQRKLVDRGGRSYDNAGRLQRGGLAMEYAFAPTYGSKTHLSLLNSLNRAGLVGYSPHYCRVHVSFSGTHIGKTRAVRMGSTEYPVRQHLIWAVPGMLYAREKRLTDPGLRAVAEVRHSKSGIRLEVRDVAHLAGMPEVDLMREYGYVLGRVLPKQSRALPADISRHYLELLYLSAVAADAYANFGKGSHESGTAADAWGRYKKSVHDTLSKWGVTDAGHVHREIADTEPGRVLGVIRAVRRRPEAFAALEKASVALRNSVNEAFIHATPATVPGATHGLGSTITRTKGRIHETGRRLRPMYQGGRTPRG